MTQETITGDMTVAEVLEHVPDAARIFQKYGIDPVAYCGPTVRILRLEETPAHCKLQNLEALIDDLKVAAEAAR